MEGEDSAIRALGSLFKFTEVYIWGDGSIDSQEVCLITESTCKSPLCYEDSGLNVPAIASGFDEVPEDAELLQQMGSLGLPVSFQSNKETRYKTKKGKRKGTHLKLPSSHKVLVDIALESTEVSEMEIVSSTVLHDIDKTGNSLCCMSTLDQSEPNYYNVAVEISDSHFSAVEDLASSNRAICDVNGGITNKLSNNGHGCELLGAVMSDDENKEILGSKNLDSSISYHEEKVKMFSNDRSTFSQDSEVLDADGIDSNVMDDECGDWRAYWDAFYVRNYFYNIKTGTSTWDPPTGMEHMAVAEMTGNGDGSSGLLKGPLDDDGLIDQSSDGVVMDLGDDVALYNEKNSSMFQDEHHGMIPSSIAENGLYFLSDAQERNGSTITEHITEADTMPVEIDHPTTDQSDIQLEPGVLIQKKAKKARSRRKKSTTSEELQCHEISEEFAATCGKYWSQRYLLFSRFDHGIKMDEEGWFSVTPELIARHHASRCADETIIDGFTGAGGNAIQFALRCKHVTAIDVDPKKIDYAYHNASIYGVQDKVDFIKGDFFVLAPKLKAGTVFLSPPWGGPAYAKVKKYALGMLRPRDGFSLFNTAKKIARKIVFFLPRNVDINQLAELSISAGPAWSLEVEKNFLNGKLKAITAYFVDTSVEVTTQLKE